MERLNFWLSSLGIFAISFLSAQDPSQTAGIEQAADTDKFLSEFMNMLTTLGVLILFIFIATWFLKRMMNVKVQQMNTTSLIKIVERRSLSPKTVLYLLEIRDQEVAIAETAHGITVLGQFPQEPSAPPPSKNFQDILDQKTHENQS